MAEDEKFIMVQSDYRLATKSNRWTINEAVNYITRYYLIDDIFLSKENVVEKYKATREKIYNIVKTSIDTSILDIKNAYYVARDDDDLPGNFLDIPASTISPFSFIVWAMKQNLPVPVEFKEILPGYNIGQSLVNKDVLQLKAVNDTDEGVIKRPDYSPYTNDDTWTLNDALDILIKHYLYQASQIESQDLTESDVAKKKRLFRELLETSANKYSCKVNYQTTYDIDGCPVLDENGHEECDIDFDKTNINVKGFIKFVKVNKIPFPDELLNMVVGKSTSEETDIVDNDHSADIVYPVYKGMKYESFDEKKFEEIKKYYGMLQQEESKWRRAIPIAAKIGLLFYERSLSKPTTRPAFLKAYKEEFDVILKNDSLAKEIYRNLPEEYKGGNPSKEPVGIDDDTVDMIIDASAFAGFLSRKEGIEVLEELEGRLAEDEYEIPTDNYLSAIKKACKKALKKYI